ncbi:hypothetical protein [Lactococcus garvieae]|uniref:hypothetical protein n=1 Tax=Lactococcus garvieae TaxID=1363 RepID=UPI00254C27E0|nr:hypothetical protein [Lactococcus garvieae]
MTPDKEKLLEVNFILSMEEYLENINNTNQPFIEKRIELLNEILSNGKKMKRIEKEKLKFAKKG